MNYLNCTGLLRCYFFTTEHTEYTEIESINNSVLSALYGVYKWKALRRMSDY